MSAFRTMLEWPGMSCTTYNFTPATKASLAAPCRRSCSWIGGNPCSAISARKMQLRRSGLSGSPPEQVQT